MNPYQQRPMLLDPVISRCAGIERKAGERLPPIGLAYVTSKLRSAGHHTKLLDCSIEGIRPGDFGKVLKRERPELVISTTSEITIGWDVGYLAPAKESGARTALCGSYPTAGSRELLERSEVDYAIRGEPETTAEELADALENGRKPEHVRGLSFKSMGRIKHNPDRPLIKDLDSLPFPAREDLPNEMYTAPYAQRSPQTVAISSRGCTYGCAFCTSRITYGRQFRGRSAENTVREMEEAQERFGIRDFSFQDDTFTLDHKRALEICRRIRESGIDAAWQCTTRADRVDRTLLAEMKKSGCYLIKYGVETGDPLVLRKMRKGITIARIRRAIAQTKKAGIKTGASYIISSPWDGQRTTERTIRLSKQLDTDYATFNAFTAFKGGIETETGGNAGKLAKAYLEYYLRPGQVKKHLSRPAESLKAAASIGRFLLSKV